MENSKISWLPKDDNFEIKSVCGTYIMEGCRGPVKMFENNGLDLYYIGTADDIEAAMIYFQKMKDEGRVEYPNDGAMSDNEEAETEEDRHFRLYVEKQLNEQDRECR